MEKLFFLMDFFSEFVVVVVIVIAEEIGLLLIPFCFKYELACYCIRIHSYKWCKKASYVFRINHVTINVNKLL